MVKQFAKQREEVSESDENSINNWIRPITRLTKSISKEREIFHSGCIVVNVECSVLNSEYMLDIKVNPNRSIDGMATLVIILYRLT